MITYNYSFQKRFCFNALNILLSLLNVKGFSCVFINNKAFLTFLQIMIQSFVHLAQQFSFLSRTFFYKMNGFAKIC